MRRGADCWLWLNHYWTFEWRFHSGYDQENHDRFAASFAVSWLGDDGTEVEGDEGGSCVGLAGSAGFTFTFALVSFCMLVSYSRTSSRVIPYHSSNHAKACRCPSNRISRTHCKSKIKKLWFTCLMKVDFHLLDSSSTRNGFSTM